VPNFNVAKFIDLFNTLMGEVKGEDMYVYGGSGSSDESDTKGEVKDQSDTWCYCLPGEAWKAEETSTSSSGSGRRDDNGCPQGRRPSGTCNEICTKDQLWMGGHDGECRDKVCMDWGESYVARAAQTEVAKAVLNAIYSDPALTKTVEGMFGLDSALNLQPH
jgi:hypothetical protein